MEGISRSYLSKGDVEAAAKLLTSLELTQPRIAKLARSCRVLADPSSVPLPHRYADIAEALLDTSLPIEAFFGPLQSVEEAVRRFNKLLLLVHPDKNPYPNASEAFVRLKGMREEAVNAVERKRTECAQLQAEAAAYEKLQGSSNSIELPPLTGTQGRKKHSRREPREGRKLTGTTVGSVPIARSSSMDVRQKRGMNSGAHGALPFVTRNDALQSGDDAFGLGGGRLGVASRTECLARPTTDSPVSGRTQQFHNVLSSLHAHKQQSFKLNCVFSEDAGSGSGPPSDHDAASSDDEEEVLACTVTSSLDGGEPLSTTLRNSTSVTTSFTMRSGRNAATECEVVDAAMKSAFSAEALSQTKRVWDRYREQHDEKCADSQPPQ